MYVCQSWFDFLSGMTDSCVGLYESLKQGWGKCWVGIISANEHCSQRQAFGQGQMHLLPSIKFGGVGGWQGGGGWGAGRMGKVF